MMFAKQGQMNELTMRWLAALRERVQAAVQKSGIGASDALLHSMSARASAEKPRAISAPRRSRGTSVARAEAAIRFHAFAKTYLHLKISVLHD